MQPQIHICPQCRSQHAESAEFCPDCGGRLTWQTLGPEKKAGSFLSPVMFAVIFCSILFVGWALLSRDKAPTLEKKPLPSAAALTASEREQVINNEFGQIVIKSKDSNLISIKVKANSENEKEKLRDMLTYLDVSRLTVQRACSLTLNYEGWSHDGEISNCAGERVGILSTEAVGYMRDQINSAIQGKTN